MKIFEQIKTLLIGDKPFVCYLKPNETSPQQNFMRTATAFASNEAHALRMYDYASKQWVGFASPVLSNAPVRTKFAEK